MIWETRRSSSDGRAPAALLRWKACHPCQPEDTATRDFTPAGNRPKRPTSAAGDGPVAIVLWIVQHIPLTVDHLAVFHDRHIDARATFGIDRRTACGIVSGYPIQLLDSDLRKLLFGVPLREPSVGALGSKRIQAGSEF
jgi:hypothetical protein